MIVLLSLVVVVVIVASMLNTYTYYLLGLLTMILSNFRV